MKTQSKSIRKRLAAQRKSRKPRKQPTAIVKSEQFTLAEAIEKVLITGDLAPLSPEQRLSYYKTVCGSLGLNPLTQPFCYISYNGKLHLYATRNCTDQLRNIHGISVSRLNKAKNETLSSAEVEVRDRTGRTDAATGEVWIKDLKGTDLCNALMKTETKAKRRATLSICGLSFLDESEIEGLDDYNEITPGGRVIVEQGQTGSIEAAQEVAARKIAEHNATKALEATGAEPAPRKIVFIKTLPNHDLAVSGYLVDEAIQKFLADIDAKRFQSAKDGGVYYRFGPDSLADFKTLCQRLGIGTD